MISEWENPWFWFFEQKSKSKNQSFHKPQITSSFHERTGNALTSIWFHQKNWELWLCTSIGSAIFFWESWLWILRTPLITIEGLLLVLLTAQHWFFIDGDCLFFNLFVLSNGEWSLAMICSAISWMWALYWMQEGIGYFHALTISPSVWWTAMNSFVISIIWFSKNLYCIWWTTMNSFFIWIIWFSKDLYWFS